MLHAYAIQDRTLQHLQTNSFWGRSIDAEGADENSASAEAINIAILESDNAARVKQTVMEDE
jgi:hypothetical protein